MTHTHSTLGPVAQRAAETLVAEMDGDVSIVIATADGFALGHAGRRPLDPARMAAVVSSLAALGDAASRETGIGTPRCLVVDSSEGRLVMRCFAVRGEPVVVVLMSPPQVLMGLALNQLAHAQRLMGEP